MRQTLTITLCFALLLLSPCSQSETRRKIGYVQITQDEVLNTAKEGVWQALRDAGFVDGQNVTIIDENAQGDLSMIVPILQSLESQGVDLIITNGTPCMVAAAQSVSNIPVVCTVTFGPEQVGMKTTPSNLYGVYDALDTEKYVDLMLECLPTLKRVGLPYNNAEPNAEYSARVFSKEFEKRGIKVIKASVTSANDLVMVGQYLAGQDIDALLVAADNTTYIGLNVLARIAADSRTPLFVTDPHQAKKGAAIGMGVNYGRWGYRSGQKAVEVLKGRSVVQKLEPIHDTELLVNQKACEAQGLVIPQSVLDRASVVMR